MTLGRVIRDTTYGLLQTIALGRPISIPNCEGIRHDNALRIRLLQPTRSERRRGEGCYGGWRPAAVLRAMHRPGSTNYRAHAGTPPADGGTNGRLGASGSRRIGAKFDEEITAFGKEGACELV